jgi:hypothetical protein
MHRDNPNRLGFVWVVVQQCQPLANFCYYEDDGHVSIFIGFFCTDNFKMRTLI